MLVQWIHRYYYYTHLTDEESKTQNFWAGYLVSSGCKESNNRELFLKRKRGKKGSPVGQIRPWHLARPVGTHHRRGDGPGGSTWGRGHPPPTWIRPWRQHLGSARHVIHSESFDRLKPTYTHQFSFLKNPMIIGAWWAKIHRASESDMTEYTCTHTQYLNQKIILLKKWCQWIWSMQHCYKPSTYKIYNWKKVIKRYKLPVIR